VLAPPEQGQVEGGAGAGAVHCCKGCHPDGQAGPKDEEEYSGSTAPEAARRKQHIGIALIAVSSFLGILRSGYRVWCVKGPKDEKEHLALFRTVRDALIHMQNSMACSLLHVAQVQSVVPSVG